MLSHLFLSGGPVMWPLLLISILAGAVVLERLSFMINERRNRDRGAVSALLDHVSHGDIVTAIESAKHSNDFVARVLVYALRHRARSFSNDVLMAANRELKRYSKGVSLLDTIITLAPLLGLLGTVTGMIMAFGVMGADGIESPTAITGGISEALIATAFGLVIACISVVPFNYLNKRLDEARQEIEEFATHLELLLEKDPVA